jgi:transcriptional regulator GlxA family with amidase domain
VSWMGRSATNTSWEQLEDFKCCYPQVQLADKLFVGEEGYVIDSFLGKVYRRRPRSG